MKYKQVLQVFLKPVEKKEREFLACYQSDVLAFTFFIYFKDNIMGSIALNSFIEMLRRKYESDVDLYLLEEKARFRSQAMLNIVTQKLVLSRINNRGQRHPSADHLGDRPTGDKSNEYPFHTHSKTF